MFPFASARADDGRAIAPEIRTRMGPSLAIAVPTFILGLPNPRHLGEALEMVHALAIGEVSIHDKHEPPVVWPVETAPAGAAPVARP